MVEAEANKCWKVSLRQLLLYVTDQATDAIEAEVRKRKLRVPIVLVGPSIHQLYYTQAGAFVKRCLAVAQAAVDRNRKLLATVNSRDTAHAWWHLLLEVAVTLMMQHKHPSRLPAYERWQLAHSWQLTMPQAHF